MNRKLRILCLLQVAALWAVTSQARVAPTTLKQLTRVSEVIVVGKITEIRTLLGVRVATVEVRQTLKGAPRPHVYYIAQGTWTCDISGGSLGEEALFFFSKPWVGEPFEDERLSNAKFAQIQKALGDSPFLADAWSGRGKMTLRRMQGKDYITLWTGDVALPSEIRTIDGPEKQYSRFIRSALLSDILAHVQSYLDQSTKARRANRSASVAPKFRKPK
jgi:hypothetical protein